MKYTIKEISQLSGLTIKSIRHYERKGLLIPSRNEDNRYRLFSDSDLDRLQQIMFYKELDFPLKQICSILNDPAYQVEYALSEQIILLKQKTLRLKKITSLAEQTLKNIKGEITMTKKEKFEAFKEKMINDNDQQFGHEIKEKYGEETYQASINKVKAMTQEQHQALEQLSHAVNEAFIKAKKTADVSSPEAKTAVLLHKKWLMHYWSHYSKEAYAGLANMYVEDPRFAVYYDKLGCGMARFVRDSILSYLDSE